MAPSSIMKPERLLSLLDAALAVLLAWMLLPMLALGREVQIPLPLGNHLSSGFGQANLLTFWVLLLIRLAASRPGVPTWLSRLFPPRPAWIEGPLVALAFTLVYVNIAHPRQWPSGDTIPTKLVPISILEEGNLDLDEFIEGVPHGRRYGFYKLGEHFYSAYPLAPAFTALPVYAAFKAAAPAAFASWREVYARGGAGDDSPNVANRLEQLSSGLIAALSVMALWLISLWLTGDRKVSAWLAVAYGLGTSLLSTAGLSLWQHAPACLALMVMLLLLLCGEGNRPVRLLLAGLCGGWAYACRPTAGLIVAILALWVVREHRRRSLWFLVPCGLVTAGFTLWNYLVFGTAAGAYIRNMRFFMPFDPRIIPVLLFSPSRGLFVFSPFLLFAAWFGLRSAIRKPLGFPAFCLYAAVGQVVLFSCWATWSAGDSFGPRYLCEALVPLAVLLPFAAPGGNPATHRVRRALFIVCVLFSCHVHLLGARSGDRGWTEKAYKEDDFPVMWNGRDSQLVWTLAGAPKPPAP